MATIGHWRTDGVMDEATCSGDNATYMKGPGIGG